MVCTAVEGTFNSVVADYRFKCPQCRTNYDPDTGVAHASGTNHFMACSHGCLNEMAVKTKTVSPARTVVGMGLTGMTLISLTTSITAGIATRTPSFTASPAQLIAT